MAGVDVGGENGRKRAINSEINMIPFIDLLMVTVAFLLITAVWVTNSQIQANAIVPGSGDAPRAQSDKALHVYVRDESFVLSWHVGGVVLDEVTVARGTDGNYTALREQIAATWKQNGAHQSPDDTETDRLVLHTDNRLPYGEIVGVMDAVNSTHRAMRVGPQTREVPAFAMTFAVR